MERGGSALAALLNQMAGAYGEYVRSQVVPMGGSQVITGSDGTSGPPVYGGPPAYQGAGDGTGGYVPPQQAAPIIGPNGWPVPAQRPAPGPYTGGYYTQPDPGFIGTPALPEPTGQPIIFEDGSVGTVGGWDPGSVRRHPGNFTIHDGTPIDYMIAELMRLIAAGGGDPSIYLPPQRSPMQVNTGHRTGA
jgi:hypothetical protein